MVKRPEGCGHLALGRAPGIRMTALLPEEITHPVFTAQMCKKDVCWEKRRD